MFLFLIANGFNIIVLLALFGWLKQNYIIFILSSAAAIIIFRTELVLLLGLFALFDIARKKVSLQRYLQIILWIYSFLYKDIYILCYGYLI